MAFQLLKFVILNGLDGAKEEEDSVSLECLRITRNRWCLCVS